MLCIVLELFEQDVEAREVAFPPFAVTREPAACLRERFCFQAARPSLSVPATRNEPRALEHLEVLGDRRLAHRKRRCQLEDRCVTGCQSREDRPARRVGERGECRVEALGRTLSITHWFHNVWVIYKAFRPLVKPGSSDFFHPFVRYWRYKGGLT